MELCDVGANLANKAFRNDLAAVLERARNASVTRVVVTGTSEEVSRAAFQLTGRDTIELYSTAGVHPHHASTWSSRAAGTLRALARETRVVAIGECGLDYDRDFSPRPAQRQCFEEQLELAAELGLPVFLHERAAHADFLAILARKRSELTRAVVHCFTGTESELRAYLDLDLHIGITGFLCDERRGVHLRSLVAIIPPERLMIETDAPYLLPRTLVKKPENRRNEPAFLTEVLEQLALAVGRPAALVAEQTTATARRFFAI